MNARATRPAYLRIADDLRATIAEAPEDSRLPTEAQLRRIHGVSRQTARRAYLELVADGLVQRIPGRGTFTTGARYARPFETIDDLMALSEDTELEVIEPLRLAAGSPRARADLAVGQVMEVRAQRLSAGQAFAVTVLSFPLDVGRRLQRTPFARSGARTRVTAIELLEKRLMLELGEAVQEVTVDPLPEWAAGLLELPAETPVLRIDRVYRARGGTSLESTVNWFHPERYTYRLSLGRARSDASRE